MIDDQIKLLERRMKATWIEPFITPVHVAYDNVDFTPRDYEEFVRLMVTQTDSQNKGPGGLQDGCFKEHGLLTVQVCCKKNDPAGSTRCAFIARKVSEVYRGWSSSGLFCSPPRVIRHGEVGEHYRMDVLIEYYEEFHFQSA